MEAWEDSNHVAVSYVCGVLKSFERHGQNSCDSTFALKGQLQLLCKFG